MTQTINDHDGDNDDTVIIKHHNYKTGHQRDFAIGKEVAAITNRGYSG